MEKAYALRKCTMKSCLNFGKFYPGLTIAKMIADKRHTHLINVYYTCSKIDFDDEVKEALAITGDRVIQKPGKVTKEHYAGILPFILHDIGDRLRDLDSVVKLNKNQLKIASKGFEKRFRVLSKDRLQAQGRFTK